MIHRRTGLITAAAVILFLGGLLINIRRITPAPHLDDLGSGSLLDSIFAIALAVLVLFLAAGLGSLLIKPFMLGGWTFIERTVIGLPLGLAAMAYGVFFMGLAGWIKPIHLIGWLIIIGLISFKSSIRFLEEAFSELGRFKNTWSNFSLIKKVIFSAGLLALLLALFQAFTPPWDYDGLAYHLQGPRLFLEAGRILPIPENWFTYYPSTWEMLYLLGMGLGSDIFARLIHFSTLVLLLLTTYSFGRRFLPKPGGWLASAILLGIPILPLWGNAAYTDIAWALFQFLAIALFLIWVKDRNPLLLALAGVMQGLALGSKYLAFSGAGILFVFVFWFSARNEDKWACWKKPLRDVLIFGLSAFIVALPWYLKNFLWTGNPVFPLYLPQNIINQAEIKIWMDYVNSFGTGKNWYDYLLLPVNIYLQHDKFGTFMGSMEMPNPLFLFVLAYPFIRRKFEETIGRSLDILAAITGILFIAWSLGSQQIRFLLPMFPGLSIITSSMLMTGSEQLKNIRLRRVFPLGLAGGMVFATLIFMGLYFNLVRPEKGLIGMENKSDFLQRMVRDYAGIKFSNTSLPENSKMMLLWDGRGYYCDQVCLPDVDQSRWTALVERSTDIQSIANLLQEEKITHLLLSNEDASFFLLKHDNAGINRKALEFLIIDFTPKCAEMVHEDGWSQLFELKYDNGKCK